MLPKPQRLHTAVDFRRLRGRGKVWRSPSFVALYLPNNKQTARLGLAVSAKIGKATVRKRASRIMRHAFSQAIPQNTAIDIVLIARPYIKDKTTTDLTQELQKMTRFIKV